MLSKFSIWMVLACIYNLTASSIRSKVKIEGTTVPPEFSRPTGKRKKECKITFKIVASQLSFFSAMQKCPSTHPYPFGDGMKCCQYERKLNDPSLAADCDGDFMRPSTSDECCYGQHVHCLDAIHGCNTAASITLKQSLTLLCTKIN